MAVSSLAVRSAAAVSAARRLGRADLAVLGFALLAVGNVWARVGAGNVDVAPAPGRYILGFALVVAAAGLCWLAASRPASLPGAFVCSVALLLQAVAVPELLFPTDVMLLLGAALAAVPLLRSARAAWLLLAVVTVVEVAGVAHMWTWGSVSNDVFSEVQGSTAALLHGQNPYTPLYAVYLGSNNGIQVFGSAAFCYGPAVLLLSIPGSVLGDVRVMAVVMNLAILAAALVWTRRHVGGERSLRVVTALWVSTPFVPYMVLMEWTDSFCVAGFAWWLVLRDRHRAWATVALTVALSSKPSVLLLMVPMLAWSAEVRRELVWAVTATVAILLPFALWTGVAQFVYDTVLVFADLPTRHDAVTVDGLVSVLGLPFLPSLVLDAGIVASALLLALRRNRDYGTLLALGSCLVIVVCLLGKQAFINYYFIAAMAILLLAGTGAAAPPERLVSPLRGLSRLAASLRRRAPSVAAPRAL